MAISNKDQEFWDAFNDTYLTVSTPFKSFSAPEKEKDDEIYGSSRILAALAASNLGKTVTWGEKPSFPIKNTATTTEVKVSGFEFTNGIIDEVGEISDKTDSTIPRYKEYLDEIAAKITDIISKDGLIFTLSNHVSMSVKKDGEWRRSIFPPGTYLDLEVCRVGARDNLLFGFRATTTEGGQFYCETDLRRAENQIDSFKDIIMMVLEFSVPLGETLAVIKTRLDDTKNSVKSKKEEKQEKIIEAKKKNPLFGSW